MLFPNQSTQGKIMLN